jgi:hypothetical protein
LFDLNRYDAEDFLTTQKLLDFVFKLDLKHSSRSGDEFYEDFKKLEKSLRALTDDDISTFISWVINVGFKGFMPDDLIEEALTAFREGDDDAMSYAIGRAMEKDRVAYRQEGWREGKREGAEAMARKMLSSKEPLEKIVSYTGLEPSDVEALMA